MRLLSPSPKGHLVEVGLLEVKGGHGWWATVLGRALTHPDKRASRSLRASLTGGCTASPLGLGPRGVHWGGGERRRHLEGPGGGGGDPGRQAVTTSPLEGRGGEGPA